MQTLLESCSSSVRYHKPFVTQSHQGVTMSQHRPGNQLPSSYTRNSCVVSFYSLPCMTISAVVHPHLGITWFRKLDTDRAASASVIFEHAYNEYRHQHEPKVTNTPSTAPKRTQSSNHFLDAVCLVDVELDQEPESPMLANELERFLALDKAFNLGDRDYPLLWWKVCAMHLIVYPRLTS
jgi:hypothetical protein